MARMVGRSRTAAGVPTLDSKITQEEGSAASSSSTLASSVSATSSEKKAEPARRVASGRAGMIRTTTVPANFSPTSGHAAAMGRGHNVNSVLETNFHPFLDGTYFVPKQLEGSAVASRMSVESSASKMTSRTKNSDGLRIENFIYLEIEVILHDETGENSISQKTLGFDGRQSIRTVMNEMCSYLDLGAIRPTHLFCKNTGLKLEDGTLASNNIENEFLVELHVAKSVSESSDHIDESHQSNTFASRINPNAVHLTLLIFNTSKEVLALPNGMLPTFEVSNDPSVCDEFNEDSKDFLWMKTRALDWEVSYLDALNYGYDEDSVFSEQGLEACLADFDQSIANAPAGKVNSATMKKLKFKRSFIGAAKKFQSTLKLNRLGHMHFKPINVSAVSGGKIVVSIQFQSHSIDHDVLKEHGLKWRNARNLHPNYFNLADDDIWALYLQYHQRQKSILAPGVYLGLLRVRNTTDSLSVLSLKHNPDLIPVARIRGGMGGTSFRDAFGAGANSQTSSRSSMKSPTSTTDLLSQTEIDYIRFLAEKEYNPVELPPAGLKITPELEAFGEKVKGSIKVLASQTGMMKGLDLGNMSQLSPVNFGDQVQVLLIAPIDDLQTKVAAVKEETKSGGGLLSKFGKMAMGKKEEDKPKDEDEPNPAMFQYLPIHLFETLHHHNYNQSAFNSYRHALEVLNMDQVKFDLGDEKSMKSSGSAVMKTSASGAISTPTMKSAASQLSAEFSTTPASGASAGGPLQQVLAHLNERKKNWNNAQSWSMRVIQQNRAVAMERKMESHR